jgi:flavin-dependent dehydrogenase
MFPYTQNRVRVGIGSLFPDVENDLRESINKLFEQYRDCGISKSAQIESHSGVIPSKGAPGQTVADGLIVTGDAANFPFGTVGEGIRMALDTGRVAGEIAAQRTVGDLTDIEPYEEYWESEYKTSLEISYAINEKISELDDAEWNKGTRMLQTISPEDFYHLLRCDFTLNEIISLGMSNLQIPYLIGKEFASSKLAERFSQ